MAIARLTTGVLNLCQVEIYADVNGESVVVVTLHKTSILTTFIDCVKSIKGGYSVTLSIFKSGFNQPLVKLNGLLSEVPKIA